LGRKWADGFGGDFLQDWPEALQESTVHNLLIYSVTFGIDIAWRTDREKVD